MKTATLSDGVLSLTLRLVRLEARTTLGPREPLGLPRWPQWLESSSPAASVGLGVARGESEELVPADYMGLLPVRPDAGLRRGGVLVGALGAMEPGGLADQWDQVLLRADEAQVLNALRLIAPGVKALHMVWWPRIPRAGGWRW